MLRKNSNKKTAIKSRYNINSHTSHSECKQNEVLRFICDETTSDTEHVYCRIRL